MAFIIKMGCENNNTSTHRATHVVPSKKKSTYTLLFDPETTNFQFETNQFIKDFSTNKHPRAKDEKFETLTIKRESRWKMDKGKSQGWSNYCNTIT